MVARYVPLPSLLSVCVLETCRPFPTRLNRVFISKKKTNKRQNQFFDTTQNFENGGLFFVRFIVVFNDLFSNSTSITLTFKCAFGVVRSVIRTFMRTTCRWTDTLGTYEWSHTRQRTPHHTRPCNVQPYFEVRKCIHIFKDLNVIKLWVGKFWNN